MEPAAAAVRFSDLEDAPARGRAQRVLGLDPGLERTGFGVVEAGGPREARLLDAGLFRFRRSASVPARLVELERDLLDLLDRMKPCLVALEQAFAHPARPRAALGLAEARGVIRLVVARAGVELVELAPSAVKKAVTGNGKAEKDQLQAAVATVLGLAEAPSPPDVADALALAVTGLWRHGAPAGVTSRRRGRR